MLLKLKQFCLYLLTPFQILAQKLGRSETVITQETVDKLLACIEPGDILLSHEKQRLTSLFIKGLYDHAAIVSHRGTVIEAVGNKWVKDPTTGVKKNLGGVREVPLQKWLHTKDYVAVIRATGVPIQSRLAAATFSIGYIGRGYDYVFKRGNLSIYCSELVFLCFHEAWPWFLQEYDDDKEILPIYYLDFCELGLYLSLVTRTDPTGKS